MSQNENMAKMKVRLRKVQIIMIRLWRELPLRRYLGHLFLLSLMGLGAWAAQAGFSSTPARTEVAASTAETTPSALDNPDTEIKVLDLLPFSGGSYTVSQVERITEVHTIFPSRPRLSVITYEVKAGDSLFGIADKFGLKPETVLWGNFEVLEDNPHSIDPEDILNISPIDGILHIWSAGESLSGVAEFFNATVQDVIDWPGNSISPDVDVEDTFAAYLENIK